LSGSFNILILLLIVVPIYSQIEITSYPFQIPSDTRLRYKVDQIDRDIVEITGAHQVWDLTKSESPVYKEIIIGISGSERNQSIKFEDGNQIRFFRRGRFDFDETGFLLHLNSSQSKYAVFNSPIPFSYRNLRFGAKYSQKGNFDIIVNREELPVVLQRELPKRVTKLKLSGEVIRYYHCDAHGRFITDDRDISALRLKVTESIELRLSDANSGAAIRLPDRNLLFRAFPWAETNTQYLFFSNASKWYFARIRPNKNNSDYIIEYQSDLISGSDINLGKQSRNFVLYPNPTYGVSKMMFINYPEGIYNLEVYSIIGSKIWSRQQKFDSESIFKIDFSFLRKGTYLISVKDRNGNPVTTRRLIIIGV
jgi:hypothetical protein